MALVQLSLLLTVALSSSIALASEVEWKSHMDAGISARSAGDYRAAAEHLEAALREAQAFGPNDRRLGTSSNSLALLYQSQGRFGEAELLYRNSLGIYERTLGSDHPSVATLLNNLASLYREQGRIVEAIPLIQRSLWITETTQGLQHPSVAPVLNNLALLYRAQGRNTEAEPLFQRSLGIAENALGPDHPAVAITINNIALLNQQLGRYAEAEALYMRSLGIHEKARGLDHLDVGITLNNIANLYQIQGRFAEAESLHRRSLGIVEKAFGPDHPNVGISLNNLAELYREQGRFTEAEPIYRRSLEISEQVLGPIHSNVAHSLNNIALLYQMQGRYAEAEPLFLRALAIRRKTNGPEHLDVAYSLNNLGTFYHSQRRITEAEPLFRRSLAIFEKSLGPDHPEVGSLLNNLALLNQLQGRHSEAEAIYQRSLRIAENALSPWHSNVGVVLNNLAFLAQKQSRFTVAESLYLRSLSIAERSFGTDHPSVGLALNNLAALNRELGNLDGALAFARRASDLIALRLGQDNGAYRRAILSEQRTYSERFELHVSLLAAVAMRGPPWSAEANQEGFQIAQLARASNTAEQVAKMAARYAAGTDALAQLARVRQDALANLEQLVSKIMQASGLAGVEASSAVLRTNEINTRKLIAELDERLEREFPLYRELTNPKPLEFAAVQKLIAKDEALLLLLVSDQESYLWALRRDKGQFFKLDIRRDELARAVAKLRAQLDLGAADNRRVLAQPFDVALAHELYQKILAPAEPQLAGVRQLIFVLDGALQSLPPGVLVTNLPAKPIASLEDHAQVAWLAKKYAISILPAVSSLRALRHFARAPKSTEPFGGFGDPVLNGRPGAARGTKLGALYSRGAIADVDEVRKLEPLPESAGELRAIASALKAPATSIRLGVAATERAVKEADLTRYRNLAFATHGLMAGDFKGLAEPALVLTPPTIGNELDDGLLTASEITNLKLDADWVILSACNTAAPDGTQGAEGLSGLARAFFYAGARSLLVSHWAVDSEAAVSLTTRMFNESAKGVPKSEALRRSMLALMQTPHEPHFAHPAFWAPFVVVGEGSTHLSQ